METLVLTLLATLLPYARIQQKLCIPHDALGFAWHPILLHKRQIAVVIDRLTFTGCRITDMEADKIALSVELHRPSEIEALPRPSHIAVNKVVAKGKYALNGKPRH